MTEFVRVKHVDTGHEFTIPVGNVTPAVRVLDKPAVGTGPLKPKPKRNLPSTSKSATKRTARTRSAAPRRRSTAGASGTKKEGSK